GCRRVGRPIDLAKLKSDGSAPSSKSGRFPRPTPTRRNLSAWDWRPLCPGERAGGVCHIFDMGCGMRLGMGGSSSERPNENRTGYRHFTRLSCEAIICQVPPRFSHVSVQTWHTFAFGLDLSLPIACSLPRSEEHTSELQSLTN